MKCLLSAMLLLCTAISLGDVEEEPILVSRSYEVSERSQNQASRFKRDLEDGKLPDLLHKGLDTALRISAYKLRREGFKKEANELVQEWENTYSSEYLFSARSRHIGDFAPISLWLRSKVETLIFLLGAETAYNLRISDLETFNSATLPVIFCRDNLSEDEYRLHWVHDAEVYKRGLAPTVIFWVAQAGCLSATLTSGFLFCTPICAGVEWLVKKYVAPETNNFMWKAACQ